MKPIFFMGIFLSIVFGINGCGSNTSVDVRNESVEENAMIQKRTDIETLQKWFPYLSGIQSAEWEVEVLGSNEQDAIPGPGSFRACGYMILDSDTAKQYQDSYQWEIVKAEIIMNVVDQSVYENYTWSYSKEWEDEVKPGYYIGNFYFSEGVVMFDVVR